MIIFGLYATPSINKHLVKVGRRIESDIGIQSMYIAWGEDARDELLDCGVCPVFLPEPNAFQETVHFQGAKYTSRSTGLEYDIKWIVDVERQFNIPLHDQDMLAQRAIFSIDYYELLMVAARPKLIVLWNGEQLYNRVLRSIASHLNVEVIFIERGPLPDTLFWDETGVNAGASFINKELSSPTLASHKYWSERITKYLLDNDSAWSQPDFREKEELHIRINYSSIKKVVFLPLQVDADTNMIMYSPIFSSTKELFYKVAPIYAQCTNTVFLVKNHPKSIAKLTVEDVSSFNNCVLVDDFSVKQILPICHHVITNNSTVGFEALLFGVTVIQTGCSFYQGRGLTKMVSSLENIDEIILGVLADDLLSENLRVETERFIAGLWDKGLLGDLNEESAVDRSVNYLINKINESCVIKAPESYLSRIMANQANTYAEILKLHVEKLSLIEEAKIIHRLYEHPVIGRVWRFWRRFINPSI